MTTTIYLTTDITGTWIDSAGVVHRYGFRGQSVAVPDDHAADLVRSGHAAAQRFMSTREQVLHDRRGELV